MNLPLIAFIRIYSLIHIAIGSASVVGVRVVLLSVGATIAGV
jgi:hypothetical protein